MIDITRAQANQSTKNGVDSDWVVTLDGEEIYKLPSHCTPQETFMIRDIIEKMMKRAAAEAKEKEKLHCDVRINKITSHRDAALNELRAENERLASILEKQLGVA